MRKDDNGINGQQAGALRREEYRHRQMIRNQEAGMAFNDFWMFGREGEKWWRKVTGSPEP